MDLDYPQHEDDNKNKLKLSDIMIFNVFQDGPIFKSRQDHNHVFLLRWDPTPVEVEKYLANHLRKFKTQRITPILLSKTGYGPWKLKLTELKTKNLFPNPHV